MTSGPTMPALGNPDADYADFTGYDAAIIFSAWWLLFSAFFTMATSGLLIVFFCYNYYIQKRVLAFTVTFENRLRRKQPKKPTKTINDCANTVKDVKDYLLATRAYDRVPFANEADPDSITLDAPPRRA